MREKYILKQNNELENLSNVIWFRVLLKSQNVIEDIQSDFKYEHSHRFCGSVYTQKYIIIWYACRYVEIKVLTPMAKLREAKAVVLAIRSL